MDDKLGGGGEVQKAHDRVVDAIRRIMGAYLTVAKLRGVNLRWVEIGRGGLGTVYKLTD